MQTVAYLRVSKDTQDVKNQKLAILDFAQKEKIEIGSPPAPVPRLLHAGTGLAANYAASKGGSLSLVLGQD